MSPPLSRQGSRQGSRLHSRKNSGGTGDSSRPQTAVDKDINDLIIGLQSLEEKAHEVSEDASRPTEVRNKYAELKITNVSTMTRVFQAVSKFKKLLAAKRERERVANAAAALASDEMVDPNLSFEDGAVDEYHTSAMNQGDLGRGGEWVITAAVNLQIRSFSVLTIVIRAINRFKILLARKRKQAVLFNKELVRRASRDVIPDEFSRLSELTMGEMFLSDKESRESFRSPQSLQSIAASPPLKATPPPMKLMLAADSPSQFMGALRLGRNRGIPRELQPAKYKRKTPWKDANRKLRLARWDASYLREEMGLDDTSPTRGIQAQVVDVSEGQTLLRH